MTPDRHPRMISLEPRPLPPEPDLLQAIFAHRITLIACSTALTTAFLLLARALLIHSC